MAKTKKESTKKKSAKKKSKSQELVKQLTALIEGGQAHSGFKILDGFPAAKRGTVPKGLPYSGWQLLEHLRITQRDILDYSQNSDGSYKPLKWPDGYWPKEAKPPSAKAWDASLAALAKDRKAFLALIATGDLYEPFPWEKKHNLLRQALLIADHTAYHLGEMLVLRRILGIWK